MNTTDTLNIYAPGNEAAWERAVRDALDKVRPGMGDAARARDNLNGARILEDGSVGRFGVFALRLPPQGDHPNGATHFRYIERGVRLGYATHPEPIGAICLALCAYRRAVEGVSDGD